MTRILEVRLLYVKRFFVYPFSLLGTRTELSNKSLSLTKSNLEFSLRTKVYLFFFHLQICLLITVHSEPSLIPGECDSETKNNTDLSVWIEGKTEGRRVFMEDRSPVQGKNRHLDDLHPSYKCKG